MNYILAVTSFAFMFLFLILLAYHMYYRKNIKHITKELEDIIKVIETNKLVTVVSNQKDINYLVKIINDLIKDIRLSRISVKRMTMRFRQGITNISHDIRTPLTTASGYVQMLQTSVDEDERQEYIKIILERQNMVKVLLEQLFEYVRIESGETFFEKVPLDAKKVFVEVIAMYYDDFNKNNEEPEVKILDKSCMILGDEKGVKRIFSNIIFNALTHGKGDYLFEIKEGVEEYIFNFSYSSEPLSQDDLDKIFDRFYTKDESRHKKTTGLGLSIAKEIISRINGKIDAYYNNGIFTISIYLPKA